MKKCSKCGEEKELDFFYFNKAAKDHLSSYCKSCKKEWTKKNQKKVKGYKLKWSINNATKEKEIKKNYSLKNLEKYKLIGKQDRKNLKSHYLITQLLRQGFNRDELNKNPEIIEVEKLIIKTKRLCKTLQNSEQV